jgi:hypothetical protein
MVPPPPPPATIKSSIVGGVGGVKVEMVSHAPESVE